MNRKKLAGKIDHTALKPNTSREEIRQLCKEAVTAGCAAVCVNPAYVSLAYRALNKHNSDVKIACVVGFPLGASKPETKALEAKLAIEDGADEIDMVMNVGSFCSRDYDTVREDIEAVVEVVQDYVVKVIIETGYLSDRQKGKACEIVEGAGAHYVKTSTGFGPTGATLHDVKLMRYALSNEIKIKAAGGVKWYEDAVALIEAGADRIGASSTLQILKSAPGKS